MALDYYDDDFDDEYDPEQLEDDYGDGDGDNEDDGLSPEDRVSMAQGVTEVRSALGIEVDKVTLKQIQDALWHYYYDVDKSVSYLTRTYIAPAPKTKPKPKPKATEAPAKKTTEGKVDAFGFSNVQGLVSGTAGACHGALELRRQLDILPPTSSFPVLERPKISPSLYFADMPWLNIPQDRAAIFIEPSRLSGGLQGGSEKPQKMSKLQALAAARKKKSSEDQGDQDRPPQTGKAAENMPLSSQKKKEDVKLASLKPERLERRVEAASHPTRPGTPSASFQRLGLGSDTPDLGMQLDGASGPHHDPDDMPPEAGEKGQAPGQQHVASAFARTLFGSAPATNNSQRQHVFAMPYTSSPSFLASAFSEPSPDDIVLAAQAKAGKKTATATTPKATKAQKKEESQDSDLPGSISTLKLTETPPPKSKGLDVVNEFEKSISKKSASFVVVGHVDAGKSTLMGRLLLELKLVEKRTVDKYRRQAEKSGKSSFALAWVMDQRSEERDRGVTIDIATNHFETETTKFTILDAPGHRDFVPNMIAGASQADFAVLVIDANIGAYEKGLKGQTREHVLLLRSLGVQRVIVAVNKLDMVGWSTKRFQEISEEVSGFLKGLGFQEKFVTFIPISGLSGDNVVQKTEDAAARWYSGPTLIEGLEASGTSTARALKKPFRMAISEVFRSQQGTATLAGRIDSGTVQIGDLVIVQPSGETAYIKSIVVDTEARDWAVAGQNISAALSGIDPIHIRIGDIICHKTDPINVGDTFTMKAMAFDHLMPMPIDLHRGRLHAAGQIQSITATLEKATGDVIKKKPKVVQPGDVARILIKLEAKVPLEPGQRVVIRRAGETIAAGLLE